MQVLTGGSEVAVSIGPGVLGASSRPWISGLLISRNIEMADEPEYKLPTWSPRLRKSQIARLYEATGRGLLDEELIDDVGYSLLARAESILAVNRAFAGRVSCPDCRTVVEREHSPDELLKCRSCGWECSWKAYHKTTKRKGLFAGGMQPFLEEFVQEFPKAKSHADRLVLVDTLIHRYHWQAASGFGRPGVSSLIEGKLSNIMPFLDNISYGDHIPKEIEATREEWRTRWGASPWKTRTEQMVARDKRARCDS